MTVIFPALGGALFVAGLIGVVVGLRKTPVDAAAPPRRRRSRAATRLMRMDRRTRLLVLVGLAAGVVVYLITGWLVALVIGPVAGIGLPILLASGDGGSTVKKLEALEEWVRSLAGVLTVGVGLEEALRMTLRSVPDAIRPEVTTLVARLRARWGTEAALRAFADDLDDATGDVVSASLILGARRRGAGLASVLESTAQSVADDVRARREIEAERAGPRSTARWVTIITACVLGVLAFTGDYIEPYSTPIGQLLITLFLAAYVGLLVLMRNMSKGSPLPRFMGADARDGAGS
ncbi:Flp pilus assembly protein TadB [Promicromonospora umidemergens]|uniref:Type II secretion system protein n=1 Tax=Promicromonospora umidemergens TaxID=629679 RepID=A0ABP8Y471_9MICO|nr:type II secretion system F family protein [Promicromonospora umidemergens]MCP2284560.1 Flp pilus assembly protein TadB [Promicromonospora umidemergens]